jgi:dTDP-L-rhamnose 4-epimerase
MHKHILVTGGAGFIGSHLVDALLAVGERVTVVDALVPQVHAHHPGSRLGREVRFIEADLNDVAAWSHALYDVDVVVHLAASVGVGQSMYEMTHYTRSNTLGTAALLEAIVARRDRLQKLVVASSMTIYGEGAYWCAQCGPFYPRVRSVAPLERQQWEVRCPRCAAEARPMPTAEDTPLYPTSIYAITKRDQEEMCLTVGRAYGIPTVALRFFNVYGPGQALSNPYTGVGAIFCTRLLNHKPPLIFEDGRQSRDFVHVSDVVQAIMLTIQHNNLDQEVFNVGTGRRWTIVEVAKMLAQVIGVDVEPEVLHQFRAGDIRHCYADITRIRQRLGYEPQVRFEDGVRDLVAWVETETAVDGVEMAFRELAAHSLTMMPG